MRHSFPFASILAPLFFSLPLLAAREEKPSISATIETTLATDSEHIRQFAFDGNPKTYFASEKDAAAKDHFTLVLDKPAAVRSVRVTTGRPDGGDKLDAGTLLVSVDGKTFEDVDKFLAGVAGAKLPEGTIQAIRIQPSQDLKYPLVR